MNLRYQFIFIDVILLRDKIAKLILIGPKAKIEQMAAEKGYAYIKEATIFDPATEPKMKERVYQKLINKTVQK